MTTEQNDPTVFQVLNEIGIIDQLARAKLERVLPDDLKISHFVVLNHLVRLGGEWNPARLAAAFQITKAAMTNTLKRLEARGLVRIEADPADGRAKLVSLTPAGKAVREQSIANIGPFLVELGEQFDDARLVDALPLLRELRIYLDEHR